ncbi:hypothetical protein BpHYR1_038340 [Brachionus plicatilis]|uniref:Uncharacterized protein n=1 Tax=Brachionus plicatilis TaxID=10195 RepID=A0A3M7RDX7_BRAPC|nr:hypothetical protein BpHYR1_038340 [Brachionus plicatilis]
MYIRNKLFLSKVQIIICAIQLWFNFLCFVIFIYASKLVLGIFCPESTRLSLFFSQLEKV